ncbi:Roadblock/LC7 family protein [Methanocaldococcus sp. FS406-22]|uniref:roadblock/LC7 domain-containing protein n=1 Tax=Methanocaldococcus sp. (strain FS406-22) TaxID=644281 RepID=UPI0001C4E10E|nr:roadblock/LC7 domain-containing protein [Methanocaldococcus sp. FS406-22]ADC68810.1 Roadblock/LC7 family protein [Methanocaldococcus sp. FS406-22]
MDGTIIFLILFIVGVGIGVGLYYYKEKEKKKTYRLIEMEIIENLKELKPYVAPDEGREYTKEFDLVEIALSYDIEDIIVVNDEGLVIASTLKDADEIGASASGIFEYIKKFYSNIKKVVIFKDDSYMYIFPLKLYDENLYVIIESKIALEVVEEKEILRKICEVLKKYFVEVEEIENETPLLNI